MVNNRTAAGAWEEFRLITNADGPVSLQDNADGLYVTADSAGAKPLIANRAAVGAWEKFDVTAATSVTGIGAFANNQVVRPRTAGTQPLIGSAASGNGRPSTPSTSTTAEWRSVPRPTTAP